MKSNNLQTEKLTYQSYKAIPLITVVTVVRNEEKTLEKTILSVINQSYPNIEYIIIDGASNDGTVDIIKRYEKKINCWISEPDMGIYDAMNKGVDLATGEWINFMNAGDFFYDNLVLENVLFHKVPDNVRVLYGSTLYRLKYVSVLIHPSTIDTMKFKMPFCHQSAFIRRCVDIHFDLKYKISADYNLFYILFKTKAVFLLLDKIIASYDGYGVSSNKEAVFKEYLNINQGSIIIKAYYKLIIIINSIKLFIPNNFIEKLYKIKYKTPLR